MVSTSQTSGVDSGIENDLGNVVALAQHECMCVSISDAAMTNVHEFASTLANEVEVHIDRHFYGKSRTGQPAYGSMRWHLQEVEAYNHELSNQWRFGYSNAYRAAIIKLRDLELERAGNAKIIH